MSDEKDFDKIIKNYKSLIIFFVIIIFVLISIISKFIYEKSQEEILKNRKYYSEIDKNFYLQQGKLFIPDSNNNLLQVPGDFSQMNASDYDEENHQSNTNLGNVYFYYKLDNKIYLVMSNNTGFDDWTIKELTSESIGIPSDAKIKYIRISGNYGYIFYVNSEGIGKILKSTTEGKYWNEIKTKFTLNDDCTLKFLNKYGMTVDGFLTVPSEDGESCDLYRINDTSEDTFEKIDLTELYDYDKKINYYTMPTYLDNSGTTLLIYAGESRNDENLVRYVSSSNGLNWKTEAEYLKEQKEITDRDNEFVSNFNKSVDNLDDSVYLIDFQNYNISSNDIKISKEKAKEIAEIGFKESASRIAGEGIEDTEYESIEIREVNANNFFTRKYYQYDDVYTNIKRKAYVVIKENGIRNGVMVYVDVTTGLIIGGGAFGD